MGKVNTIESGSDVTITLDASGDPSIVPPKERIRVGAIGSKTSGSGSFGTTEAVWGIRVKTSKGEVIKLNEDGDLTLGGFGADGDLSLKDKSNQVRIEAGGDEHTIRLKNDAGNIRITLDANSGTGKNAIEGKADSLQKSGVYGESSNSTGFGVRGKNTNHSSEGELGTAVSFIAFPNDPPCGVAGRAVSNDGIGVQGAGDFAGVLGNVEPFDSPGGKGVLGMADTGVEGDGNIGVFGKVHDAATAEAKVGVKGEGYTGDNTFISKPGSIGVLGLAGKDDGSLAGRFEGDVEITGGLKIMSSVTVEDDLVVGGNSSVVHNLIAFGSKYFKIDHPLDPANKYLMHSSVESSHRMNIYNGTVKLDGKGEAWVKLPNWFAALNGDFQYQLTPVGAPAPNLHIAKEIRNNRFRIAGGQRRMKVSWQVTGVRRDAYARAHPMRVEVKKEKSERGLFLHPTEHGKPENKGIHFAERRRLRERSARLRRVSKKRVR
jgi:hypothetical protein